MKTRTMTPIAGLAALMIAASPSTTVCYAAGPATSSGSSSAPAPSAAAAPSASSGGSSAAIESQILAFQEADALADKIVSKVCGVEDIKDPATIVIYDQTSFASLQAFEAFAANIKVVVGAYKTLIPDLDWLKQRLNALANARKASLAAAPAPAGHFAAPFVSHLSEKLDFLSFTATGDPFSDFVSLLQAAAVSSNVETPSSVTIPDSTLAVAITQRLIPTLPTACTSHFTTLSVIYPPLFGSSSASDFASADIDIKLQILEDVRQAAHESVLKAIQPHKGAKAAKDKSDDDNGDANAVLAKSLQDIDGVYDTFMSSLLQVNGSTGAIGSAAVIQGYRLATILSDQSRSTWTLLATVVGAGGTEHDHKTFWTALGSGDKLTYSGGLIVNVVLWNSSTGDVKLSEVMKYKTAFVNADGAVSPP